MKTNDKITPMGGTEGQADKHPDAQLVHPLAIGVGDTIQWEPDGRRAAKVSAIELSAMPDGTQFFRFTMRGGSFINAAIAKNGPSVGLWRFRGNLSVGGTDLRTVH